ncbi:aldehyde dehydrogenase family protein [Paraburkholderia sp.]|uniref:aldehyde dehydrogenase family protein n=1 Tax=Paraburkholderia sp. TaxID=1926495 RepID=UPI00239DF70E|nr:aldehyde dehydrogenase family protein [Paraburkholderia sp.]MDE1180062.1 aldehyde dehydrogenase family protein [Paraburkholderia sp.]
MTSTLHPGLGDAARGFLLRTHQLLIGGRMEESDSGRRTEIVDPGTGAVITTAAEASASDVDRAVVAARRAFEGPWSKVSPAERTRMMLRFATLIEDNADELAELECINSGKPLPFCRNGDVVGIAEMLRYMAGWTTKMGGETPNVSLPGDWHAYTLREPVGVVGQIIPWNFPLNMAMWKIAPALATGCTIVMKPSEQTPLTALRLGELALEAGIPAGVLNIVTGFGNPVGAAIAAHPGIDKVAFTGSGETGRRIVQAASGNLKRVSLELGGKSPVIVFPDANLDAAAAGVCSSIFFHAGQICAAGSRLYVHERAFDEVLDGIAKRANAMKMGHGMDAGTQMGPVISRRQLDRVAGYIDRGQQEGATLFAGGGSSGEHGFFVQPTVLTGVKPGMCVHDEEIFGPVLCAMSFSDDDLDGIAATANATTYGLAASIWTRDIGRAHKMARRMQAGIVNVNALSSPDATLPYGGYKQSGWGRERGYDAIRMYTEVKAVAINLNN